VIIITFYLLNALNAYFCWIMNILQTENIKHSYSDEISFEYPKIIGNQNEELLIIGNSGSGKSTLLHLLGLILPLQKGKIEINGIVVNDLSSKEASKFRAKHIGFIFQQHYFIKSFSVIDNLILANYYAKSPLDKKNALSLLARLDIEKLANKPIFELSGGEMQRVGIARALMNKPSLILADEPTSSLDDKNCMIVHDLLSKTAKEQKAALIIVTHDQRLKDKTPNQIHL
jgi:ABC-type lipoprotein export system ATPase subunit